MKKPRVLSIGDLTTDAFIKLHDAEVHNSMREDEKLLCMTFGDKVPYESVKVVPAVGNSANASVSLARLGLDSYLYTNIGRDRDGEDALKILKENNVSTKYVVSHKKIPTNYHYVLSFRGERTILIKHNDYPYKMPKIKAPDWVYLSSLGENSSPFHKTIEKYLKKNPKVKLAFQPGTFQMKMGAERLKGIYENTEIFFSNKEEAQRILGKRVDDVKKLLNGIRGLGPEIAVITDGREGAYVADGKKYLHMPIYPDPKPPLERTGAGDSFSSAFTAALASGLDIEDALIWGPINSMSVVQYIGARDGLLSRKEIEKYARKAPKSYKPKEF